MDDQHKQRPKQLWEQLDNEPANAFAAFGCFDSLDPKERSLLAAYRIGVRADARKISDTWAGWSRQFAWQERALAHDRHLDGVRRKGVEEAIEEEAKRHARLVERTRYETLEELSAFHDGVMEYLANLDWSSIRMQDVIQIVKLKLDATMRFEEAAQARAGGAGGGEPEWTLEEREFTEGIVRGIEAEGDREDRLGEGEEPSKS